MLIDRPLQRWIEGGLVSAEQAERIRAFERGRGPDRPVYIYVVAGLGGLAIATGLVSIVAANWDRFPGGVKLGADLALVAGLGWGVVTWERSGPAWARETAIVFLHGLVLASIALIGQVYQLGGRSHEALGAWSLLTALLMSRARSGFVAAAWILGLEATWAAWAVWLADKIDDAALALGSSYWVPLVCILVGRSRFVQGRRPALARVLSAIGWGEVVLCGLLGTFAFYADTAREDWTGAYWAVAVSAVLTAWIALQPPTDRLAGRALLVGCLLLVHIPLFVSVGDLGPVAALTFVALWALVAWTAQRTGDASLFNLATAAIGIRILVAYFEAFGSLLDTGLGLVGGGLLTVALVWLWARKRKDFARELER